MLKYLNLAVLLPTAKCYQNFIGSTWEIVWGLVTRLFYTHNIIYEIKKGRKMVFFPALTLNKASGLVEIPSICCEWHFNPGLSFVRVWCISVSRWYLSRWNTSLLLPKGLLSCQSKDPYSHVVFRCQICSANIKESGFHPALTEDALWVHGEVVHFWFPPGGLCSWRWEVGGVLPWGQPLVVMLRWWLAAKHKWIV